MEPWLIKYTQVAPLGILATTQLLWMANGGQGGVETFAILTGAGTVCFAAFLVILECVSETVGDFVNRRRHKMFYAIHKRNQRIRKEREAIEAAFQIKLTDELVADIMAELSPDTAREVHDAMERLKAKREESA